MDGKNMLSGTPNPDKTPPVSWPAQAEAAALLRNWLSEPIESSVYANERDFRGADLTDVSFYHLFGIRCNFSGTVLVRTDFGGSYLLGTDFTDADLTGAVLAEGHLTDSVFEHAAIRGGDLRDVDARRASFAASDMRTARIGGFLEGCNFSHTDLRNAQIDGLFSWSVLTGARVEGARGTMRGPIVVDEGGQRWVLHETQAQKWLSARGAVLTVEPEITDPA